MKAIGVVLVLAASIVPGTARSADASAPQPTGANAGAATWTPDRVRDFVLNVEREMAKLQHVQFQSEGKPLPVEGTCHGERLDYVVKTSVIMPRLKAMFGSKALACYATTYLGCSFGPWIGRGFSSEWGAVTVPFTLSKVTILEQTPDKVVADVLEAPMEYVHAGVSRESDGDGHTRPSTEQEVSGYNTISRYTITQGNDGIWRISDRKPPFKWECASRY